MKKLCLFILLFIIYSEQLICFSFDPTSRIHYPYAINFGFSEQCLDKKSLSLSIGYCKYEYDDKNNIYSDHGIYNLIFDNEIIFKKYDNDNVIYSPKLSFLYFHEIGYKRGISFYYLSSLALGYYIEFNNNDSHSAVKIIPELGIGYQLIYVNVFFLITTSYNVNLYDRINSINKFNLSLKLFLFFPHSQGGD